MDELKKNIEQILDQFAREEMGNRLSQFAFIALKNLILEQVSKVSMSKSEKEDK